MINPSVSSWSKFEHETTNIETTHTHAAITILIDLQTISLTPFWPEPQRKTNDQAAHRYPVADIPIGTRA